MADNSIALGIQPMATPDYAGATMNRLNMMQHLQARDEERQASGDRELRLGDEDLARRATAKALEDALLGRDVKAMRFMADPTQRTEYYKSHVAPILLNRGITQAQLDQITPESVAAGQHLTNSELDQLDAQLGVKRDIPKLHDIGGMPYTQDPDTGAVTMVQGGRRAAPAGYEYGADGKLAFIPGGPGDPNQAGSLASARRAPATAAGGGKNAPWSSY
jgi:hypothetical protein